MLGWVKTLTKKFDKLPALGQFAVAVLIIIVVRYLLHLIIYSNYLSSYLENFGNPKELVYFHMNGCGHCKKMMPEWDKFQQNAPQGVKVSKVEQAEKPDLMQKLGIQGFPTIKLFNNGKPVKDYNGERTAEAFASFAQSA